MSSIAPAEHTATHGVPGPLRFRPAAAAASVAVHSP